MRRFICYTSKVFPIFLFLALPWLLFAAETGKIAGKIIDNKTGEPLVGANIIVNAIWLNNEEVKLNTPQGTASGKDGHYFILNVRPGEYNVKCFFMGYRGEQVTKVRIFIDRTTVLNFEMKTEVLEGEEVVVTAYRPNKVERDLTATKQTYTIAEVEQLAGVNEISDILELQADVVDNHFRGGREGESLNLIEGASINNPLNSSRSFEPMVIALQEVEVLTSGFSAEYGNAQSGVINMVPREGGDRWSTRIEYSMDLPHYQLWGGNPYSEKNMPFYLLLSQPEEWLVPYEEDGQIKYLIRNWDEFIPPENRYDAITDPDLKSQIMLEDSLRAAKMASINWLQMARDVGLEDDWLPYHRIDITAGGPIFDNVRLFVAARQSKDKPVVPVPHSNLKRQWMNNLTVQLSQSDKLTMSYHYNYSFRNSVGGPTNWFDTIIHNSKTVETSKLLGIRWNHVFNQVSFMDVAIRLLDTNEEERPEFLDPDRYVSNAFNGNITNNTYAGRYDNTPSGHRANNLDYDRGIEKTKTYTFDGNFTRQINTNNLLKSGIQFQAYAIDVNQEHHLTSPGEYSYTRYSVSPYEGALYLQDKMEFEGFIANIGLRYDFYNFNYRYFSNLFTPLFNPEYPEKGDARDPEYALKQKTRLFGRLQPRLGISFPVSENTVFHLNYGTFIQRPGFNYILRTRFTSRGNISQIGNARLKPEKTSTWDIGIVRSLPLGFRIDISAYFKDVNDLTEEAVYVNAGNETYVNYTNRDYANIKGFHVNLEKSSGFLNTYLRYNYQTAKGKASAPGGALVTIYETPLSDGITVDLPDPRDIFMDYDRTHRLVANFRINTSSKAGPKIFKFQPFGSLSISATFKYQSGRPYTDDEKLLGLVFNKRIPSFQDLRLRVQKTFQVGGFRYAAYLEGYNILDYKEWSRQIFTDEGLLKRWKRGDRNELIWYDPTFEEDPNERRVIYQYSDANSVYDNEPRYFRIGLRVQM